MKRAATAALSAAFVFLLAFSVLAVPGFTNNTLGIKGWWVPSEQITGYEISIDGGTVSITPTAETLSGAPAGTIRLTKTVAKAEDLDQKPVCRFSMCAGQEWDSPTDTFARNIMGAELFLDFQGTNLQELVVFSPTATVVTDSTRNQPKLTLDRLRDAMDNPKELGGRDVSPQQRATLEALAATEPRIPGNLYVTAVLEFKLVEINGVLRGRYVVDRFVYRFEANWSAVLDQLDVCPRGQEGAPPNCVPGEADDPGDNSPPRPPAEPDCPPNQIRDDRGHCRVPPEGWVPGGRVDPGLRFRLSD